MEPMQSSDAIVTMGSPCEHDDGFTGSVYAREALLIGVLFVIVVAFIWRECKRCFRPKVHTRRSLELECAHAIPSIPTVPSFSEKSKV